MKPKNNAEELSAVKEAKRLVHSKPKEAAALLAPVIAKYQSEGKTLCALEVRRWQCFAYISNLNYEAASEHIELLSQESSHPAYRRFLGIAQMYHGIVAVECGNSEAAVESFGHAIQIATELEDLDLLYRVQTNLAYAQMTQDRCEDALETLKNCIRHFDVDNVSVSNSTIFYNIAATTLLLAFHEYIEGNLTQERLGQAKEALANSFREDNENQLLSLLTKVQSALFTGLAGEPEKGLAELQTLESAVKISSASHHYTFSVVKCQLLEVGGKWPELCAATASLLEEVKRSRSYVYVQALLRQSARAHARVGDFETAFYMLQESLKRANRSRIITGEDRAKYASLQQDLERQKFDQDVLRMRNKTLIERNKVLELEARYDPLSALLNRRGTEEALQQYSERRIATRFLIALLDIDHFKRINDKFGHAIGDQVIHEFASCLTNSASNPAKIGRWGGEEFLIVYDVTDDKEMDMIGRTLVEEIRNLNWDHIHHGMRVTASIGLSMWRQGDSVDNAVRIADDMLYEVKHHGRDNWRAWPLDAAA